MFAFEPKIIGRIRLHVQSAANTIMLISKSFIFIWKNPYDKLHILFNMNRHWFDYLPRVCCDCQYMYKCTSL